MGGTSDNTMELVISRCGNDLVFELLDDADFVDTDTIKARDLEDIKPGGLGVHLINEIMDTVEFLPRSVEGGNILRMTRKTG